VSGYALAGYVAGIGAYLAALHFNGSVPGYVAGIVPHLPALPGM